MIYFATGTTGTIGRCLSSRNIPINLELVSTVNRKLDNSSFQHATVIHLAGIVGESCVKANKSKSRLVNVQGTLNLAERALSFGVSRFVFASTSHVYAQSQNPLKESSPLSPISIYAEQKLEAEEGLTKLFKRSGAELVVIRIFSVLDWGTKFHTLGGLVGRIANGQADLLVSNGDDVRDFLTPSKIAHCLDRIAGEENMTGIWNLGSGRALSVKSAVQVMLESKGFLNPEKFVLSGNSDLPYVVGDIGKIQKQIPSLKLYWEPRNSTRISNEPSGIS